MDDELTQYEKGMRRFLEGLGVDSPFYQEALLFQMRLEKNIARMRRYGRNNPVTEAEQNEILDHLNNLSMHTTNEGFNKWCELVDIEQQGVASAGTHLLDKYIGNLEFLRKGKVHQALTDALKEKGVKSKIGKIDEEVDILERYRTTPLHAIFLYTSEDPTLASYISEHWGALDTLAGDFCDIHPIVAQFNNVEDGYDLIDHLDVIKDTGFHAHSQLPGIFFWDEKDATEYIAFGHEASPANIKKILRIVFEEIRRAPVIASVRRAKRRLG